MQPLRPGPRTHAHTELTALTAQPGQRRQRVRAGVHTAWCALVLCALAALVLPVHAQAQAQAPAQARAQAQVPVPAQGTDLRSLLGAALSEHPTLRARQADIGAAQSELEAVRWQYWPTPTVSVQRPDQPLIKGTDRAVQLVGVKQPLWTGGRLEAATAQVQARKSGAEAAWQEARRDIALELIQAYGEAHTARARALAWGKSLQAHQRLLEQIRRRAGQGLSAQSDIELAEGRRQAVLADQMNAQSALDAALERLRTLTGGPVAAPLLAPPALLQQPPTVDAATEQALQTDPTLARLRTEAQELLAQVDSNASALWPELSLSLNQRRGDVTGHSTQVMLGFESRWGGGLSNLSAIQAARQRAQAKNEDIDYRTRRIGEQIRSDLRLLASSRERVLAYQSALAAAQAVALSWDRQYFAGKKSWQEVMNAARETAQTEVQLIDAAGAAAVTEWRLAVFTRGIDWVVQGAPQEPR